MTDIMNGHLFISENCARSRLSYRKCSVITVKGGINEKSDFKGDSNCMVRHLRTSLSSNKGFPSRCFLPFGASSWLMTKRIHLEQACAGDSCRDGDPTHYKATSRNTTPVNQMNGGAGFFVVLVICCGYSLEITIWFLSCRGGKSFKNAESAPLSRT